MAYPHPLSWAEKAYPEAFGYRKVMVKVCPCPGCPAERAIYVPLRDTDPVDRSGR